MAKKTPAVGVVAYDSLTIVGLRTVLRTDQALHATSVVHEPSLDVAAWVHARKVGILVLELSPSKVSETIMECLQLRDHCPQAKVIVVVASAKRGLAQSLLDAGAHAVISRRSDPKEVLRAIAHVGRGRTYICSALRSAEAEAEAVSLSTRQETILTLMANGFDTNAIAERLGLQPETVKSHVKNILRKLHATNRAHAVSIGLREHLIA